MSKKVKSKFTCPICTGDDFTDMDYLRTKKENFVVCNKCAFVTYKIDEEEMLIDMYKNHKHNKHRMYSGSMDDKTKINKLSYHRRMLEEILVKKQEMSILDFGCSTGYVLKMCRDEFGHKDVEGIELNAAHAAYGRGDLGIDIHEITDVEQLPDKNKKYDLIICFAVLEHLLEPVEKMKKFKKLLKPDGQMYIMVPLWFNGLLDSEKHVGPFEHLFVPHHINCFTRNHLNNVLNMSGFDVQRYENNMYGHMFILGQCEPKPTEINFEDSKKRIEEISKIQIAIDLHFKRKFDDSLEAYPINPEAWVAKGIIEFKENAKGMLDCFFNALKIDPSHSSVVMQIANTYMQLNDYPNALEWNKKAIKMSPNCFQSYYQIAEIHHIKQEYQESIDWCKKLIRVNPNMKDHVFFEGAYSPRDMIGMNYANMAK